MKTRYSSSKDFKKSYPTNFEATEYRKVTPSVIGSKVYGIVCSKSSKFGGYTYALACTDSVGCYWLNIPTWLGKLIIADFNDSGQECGDYFKGKAIKNVTEIPTDKGNPTFDIEFEE